MKFHNLPHLTHDVTGQHYRQVHSGQTTGHPRDLSTSGRLPVTFPFHHTKFPRSTSATRAISVLKPIILPLQTFFSRVLLLRKQAFSSGNLLLERPTTTTAIKTQVLFLVLFHYERVNSTRKFTIVAEIVSLLKEIYKRDAPFRAVFKVRSQNLTIISGHKINEVYLI